MASELDGARSEPGPLLLHLQQMTEVIAQQNAALISLQAERDTAWSERDAAQVEIEKLLPWAWNAERLAAAVHA